MFDTDISQFQLMLSTAVLGVESHVTMITYSYDGYLRGMKPSVDTFTIRTDLSGRLFFRSDKSL
jgi:hypothetical protein